MGRSRQTYLKSLSIPTNEDQNEHYNPSASSTDANTVFPPANNADPPSSDAKDAGPSPADESNGIPSFRDIFESMEGAMIDEVTDQQASGHSIPPSDPQDPFRSPVPQSHIVDETQTMDPSDIANMSTSHSYSEHLLRSQSVHSNTSYKENICPNTPYTTTPLLSRSPYNIEYGPIITRDHADDDESPVPRSSLKRKSSIDDILEKTINDLRKRIKKDERILSKYRLTSLKKPLSGCVLICEHGIQIFHELESNRNRLERYLNSSK
jgi:hypothetical protein